MKEITLGTLFDGIGGFPYAALFYGIRPVWASEVLPTAISVTKRHIPEMVHVGDITKLDGRKLPPVDIITFGSPCQGLSISGRRLGLADERSGLFSEAIRIIREMQEVTHGQYPQIAIWENVPGALSSAGGCDFAAVLQAFTETPVPMPYSGRWANAGMVRSRGIDLAWCVYDAQYFGTAQRRRRVFLVADFRGKCAGQILFVPKSLRGYFEAGRTPWQGIAADAQNCVGTAIGGDCTPTVLAPVAVYCHQGNGKSPTLRAEAHGNAPYVINKKTLVYDTRGNGAGETVPTITGDHNNRITDYTALCCEAVVYDGANITSPLNKTNPQAGDPCHTISNDSRNYIVHCLQGNGIDRHAVCFPQQAYNKFIQEDIEATFKASGGTYGGGSENLVAEQSFSPIRYIVRRLTPTECARLQGFPDWWGEIPKKDNLTDDEYVFWLNARNTYAKINNKTTKEYSKEQMLSWYNKLHSDSSEYKMWGNGIALPNALYVMQGIAEVVGVHHSK